MLLAIDTCGDLGSAVLADVTPAGMEVRAEADLVGKTYSALLIPTIWELLEAAGARIEQMQVLVVVNGPGSFTGVRVGVSAIKGLAEAAGLQVIAVSRLELLARRSEPGLTCAVLDAGRGEFYAGLYDSGMRVREALVSSDQLRELLVESGARLVICEERLEEKLSAFAPELVNAPTAVDAARAGAERLTAGIFDDVVLLDGNYLRRSDAEIFAKKATPEPAAK